MKNDMLSKTVFGFIWKYAERCSAQLIQFIVSIVLARLLTPEDYGLIGIITVFITISVVFAQSGLGAALVQKKEADKTDFSTVFFFSLFFSVILYIILFLCAPFIAAFFKQQIICPIIRVLGITIIINSVNSVQQAYIQRKMQFRLFFWGTLVGTMSSSIVGIGMAYSGYGVWALVGQQISNQLMNMIILFCISKWRPMFTFSFSSMKKLFSYGWKLLCSSLIDTVYNNIYTIIIGKFFSASDLGYYNQGKQFPMFVVVNINGSMESVLFPALSQIQDDNERFKAVTRRLIKTSTFLIFPAMAGLAAIAKPLTIVLLTEKWLPAVPFIWFCTFTYAFWPIQTANLQAIKAIGRSDIFLKLEIIKKIIGVVTLLITLPHGIIAMMWGRCVSTILSMVVNIYPNRKLLRYGYKEQIKDFIPSMTISIIMCIVVLLIGMININNYLLLCIEIVAGVVVYYLLAKIFKIEALDYILNLLKRFNKKRTKAWM